MGGDGLTVGLCLGSQNTGLCKCFPFECIVQIRIASVDKLKQAGKEVKGKEQHSPTLVLSNVHVFVEAMMRKRFVVDADDDMAKSYGTEATTTREHGNAFIDAATCNLERSFDNSAFSAEGNRNERKQQARECGRHRPSVSSNDKNAVHDWSH
jgi:hypothetical protein